MSQSAAAVVQLALRAIERRHVPQRRADRPDGGRVDVPSFDERLHRVRIPASCARREVPRKQSRTSPSAVSSAPDGRPIAAGVPARTTRTTPASRVHRAHLKTAAPRRTRSPNLVVPATPTARARSGPGPGPGPLACFASSSLARDPVSAHLDRKRVEHAITARDRFPTPAAHSSAARNTGSSPRRVQVSLGKAGQVLVEHESRAAADGGNRRAERVQPEGCG